MLRKDDEITDGISPEISATIAAQFVREIKGADAVIISDYNKGLFTKENSQRFIQTCKEFDVPVIVDFKPSNMDYFKNADVIGPNRKEAAEIIPEFATENLNDPKTRKNLLSKLYNALQSDNVLVTLGEEGICSYDGKKLYHSPAKQLEVVDTVGCGDTVRAIFALAWASGLSMQESLDLANIAAGIVIRKLGTASITVDELINGVTEHYQCFTEVRLAANS